MKISNNNRKELYSTIEEFLKKKVLTKSVFLVRIQEEKKQIVAISIY